MSRAVFQEIQSWVDGVDQIAREMEAKWGVGRLRLLAPDEMRVKFDRQAGMFNTAVWSNDLPAVREHAPAMKRGWAALDRIATEAGHSVLAPEVWECASPDGEVIAIVRTTAEAVQLTRENRAMQVWTLDELGHVLGKVSLIGRAKVEFEGSRVTAVREKPPVEPLDDDLPSHLLAG